MDDEDRPVSGTGKGRHAHTHTQAHALVVGAGPAGLMAAEIMASAGLRVTVADAMPSPARKFLMAGKSGLNLTNTADHAAFASAYGAGSGPVPDLVAAFGPRRIAAWAEGLGQPLFTGTTGRVFPVAMKASPLLRAWLARLDALGVTLHRHWRWRGFDGDGHLFDTPDGPRRAAPDGAVLAMGGASWRRLGSDGAWADVLGAAGVPIAPFAPANAGLRIAWSDHMAPLFGAPVKGAALSAGRARSRGEFVISKDGLEGGGIYAVSRAVREGAPLSLDLCPDMDAETARARLAAATGSVGNRLRKALRLSRPRLALAMEFGRPLPSGAALADTLKALPVRHRGLGPLDAAISTAGGLAWDALGEDLMLRARPGTFAAGEMLDWEAPTGGYLLTACFATGWHAGRAAARWLGHGAALSQDERPR